MVAGGRGREGVLGQNVIYVAGCRAYQMKPTVSVIVRCGVELGSRCYKSGQLYVNQCSPFLGFLIFGETCYYLYITYHTVFAACTIMYIHKSLLYFSSFNARRYWPTLDLAVCTNSRSGLDQTNYTLCMVGGTNHTPHYQHNTKQPSKSSYNADEQNQQHHIILTTSHTSSLLMMSQIHMACVGRV